MVAELVPKPPSLGEQLKQAADHGGIEGAQAYLAAAARLAGLPSEPSTPARKLHTISDLGNYPPPSWLVPGEVPDHALTMLVGASGGGKSFAAIDYAFRIAAQHGRKVIYLAAEGASGYYDRATAWCKHHKYSGDGVLFDIQPLTLRDPEAVRVFIDTIKLLKPALVVIDTLARCMLGLDENSARDMGIAVEACATIIRETGAAVLLVHHTGKSGTGERGSSALYAACDSVITLSNDDGLITLSCAKSKDGKPFADRYLRLVEVAVESGRTSCVALPSDRVITRGAPISPTQKRILETLALETFIVVGAKAQSLMNQAGVTERNIYRALASLMREGYVRQAAKGDPYFIEEKGLQAVQLSPLTSHDNGTSVSPITELTALTHSFRSVSVSQYGSSGNGGQENEENNPLPYLDALTKPLHGSNGRHG